MPNGWLDLKADFGAVGNFVTDDTAAIFAAIAAGSSGHVPVFIPPGSYRYAQTPNLPSNTMLIGSNPGMTFGTIFRPDGCAAFNIGVGSGMSFHGAISDLMIWPTGAAPNHIIKITNSYSWTFRNLRIHNAQPEMTSAALLLSSEFGRSNNIIWDNLIIRTDPGMPNMAILAEQGCGTHRFLNPNLEHFLTLFEWCGGNIDIVTPYAERFGKFGVHCNLSASDLSSPSMTIFGGEFNAPPSSVGCAIRSSTKNFNSFGTRWYNPSGKSVHVYSNTPNKCNFHGLIPNLSGSGANIVSGYSQGWSDSVCFPDKVDI